MVISTIVSTFGFSDNDFSVSVRLLANVGFFNDSANEIKKNHKYWLECSWAIIYNTIVIPAKCCYVPTATSIRLSSVFNRVMIDVMAAMQAADDTFSSAAFFLLRLLPRFTRTAIYRSCATDITKQTSPKICRREERGLRFLRFSFDSSDNLSILMKSPHIP